MSLRNLERLKVHKSMAEHVFRVCEICMIEISKTVFWPSSDGSPMSILILGQVCGASLTDFCAIMISVGPGKHQTPFLQAIAVDIP